MVIRCPRCGADEERMPTVLARLTLYRCAQCSAPVQIGLQTKDLARKLDELDRALRGLFGDPLEG
jgi:DNA-directed RNA polymerase subunit RPC12/RpoP